jgi:hypothetical protein
VLLLLEHGAGRRGVPLQATPFTVDSLSSAAAIGCDGALRLLPPLFGGPGCAADVERALNSVCLRRDLRMLTLMLDSGAAEALDPRAVNAAVANGWLEGLRLLLAHGATPPFAPGPHGQLGSAASPVRLAAGVCRDRGAAPEQRAAAGGT